MRTLFNKAVGFGTAAVIRAKAALSGNQAEGFVDTAVFSLLRCYDSNSHDSIPLPTVKTESIMSRLKGNLATYRTNSRMVLADNRGEGYIDTAVKILIAVVLGALLLAGLYLLFSGTVLPTLTQKIQEMFGYSG